MVEALFLYGINMDGDGAAVDEAPQLASDVRPRPAFATPARKDDALLGAQ
jgi:hypothetical protein